MRERSGAFVVAEVAMAVDRSECPGRLADPGYEPFQSARPTRDRVEFRCTEQTWRGRDPGRGLFESGDTWSLRERPDDLLFLPYHPDAPHRGGGEARIGKDWRAVQQYGCHAEQPALSYPLDELVLMHVLPDLGGLLLHASAVLWQGEALLFAGPSGAGKTTLSGLWQAARGVTVLSDDRVGVRLEGERVTAHGTPWHGAGRFAAPGSAPIRAIHLLRQAPRNALERVGPEEALDELIRVAFLPYWDPQRTGRGLDALTGLLSRVPVFAVQFTKSSDVVEELWPQSA